MPADDFPIAPEEMLDGKAVYLDNPRAARRPAWLLPLIIAAGALLLVFWTGPHAVRYLSVLLAGGEQEGKEIDLLYDSPDYAVVRKQSADLFREPDLRSGRVSQVLYNDLVRITGRDTYGFVQVSMPDGTAGYLMTGDIDGDTLSAEPGYYKHKLTVISKTKRIMSHAANGSLLTEVYMGTVLYSDFRGDGIYRVALPEGGVGWIGSEGVIRTDVDSEPAVSSAKKFYETVLSFVNTTYVENGLTCSGASSSGAAYICAKINGVTIPRDPAGQAKAGTAVPISLDAETNLPLFTGFRVGDLVFFHNELAPEGTISSMGVVVGQGQLLMSGLSGNSVKIVSLEGNTDLLRSILTVRRIFDTDTP